MDDDIPSWDAVYRKIQGGKLEIVSSESLQGFVFKLIYHNEPVKLYEEYILKIVVLSDENEGSLFPDGHRSVALSPMKTTATLSQFAREYYLQKFVHKQTSLSVKVYDFSYMDWFASRKLLDELRLISDSDTRRALDTLKSYKRAIGIITMDVADGWLMKPEMLTDFEVHQNYALQNIISAQIMVLFTHCRIIDTDNNFMVDGSKVTMIDFGKAIQLDDFYQRDILLDFYETKAGVPFTYSSVKLTKVEFIETLKKIAILYYCIFKTFYATDDSVELLVFKHLFDTPGWGETPEETDLPYHFDPRQKEWKRHDHFDKNLKEIMDLYVIMSTSEGEYHPPTNLSKFDQTKSFCKGGMCENVTRAFTYVAGERITRAFTYVAGKPRTHKRRKRRKTYKK